MTTTSNQPATKPAKPAPRPTLSLTESAARLEQLAERLDAGEPLTPLFQAIFAQAKLEHVQGVADAINFCASLEALLLGAKRGRDAWAERARQLKSALEAFKAEAVKARAAYPNLPWTDTYGARLSLCNNSSASLVHDLPLSDMTARGVLEQEDVDRLPAKYVKIVSYLTLNAAAVKEDLKAGVQLPWARLERGQHVRGWTKISGVDDDAGSN